MSGKRAKEACQTKVRAPAIKSKVACHVLKKIKPSEELFGSLGGLYQKSLVISVGTVNKIIKSN